ncbi:hypothetical protein TNCV_138351 [Trichonephila clavipes]|nr:hypothetical protein TNCV_138351 [Trichonephila clavipes]
MTSVLADCERKINSKSLTYIWEEEVVKPITPSMSMQDVHECHLTDLNAAEENYFCEIVMVVANNKKRITWPLGCIAEIITSKDRQIRFVRV